MITKPLIRINKTATKMANLDFTEKCEVSSEDEIGSLSASLNFLSDKLHSALSSLRQANAKLEEDILKERNLEKMRKEFVAAVSHELKTPISLIDGYAVGLKDDIFEDKDKDYYIDIIIDEARKMGHLVSDMLDLSQLESGVFKLKRENFDLVELIKATARKYENLAYEKAVDITLELFDSFTINGDYNKLEQVLTNFITNALRHVEDSGHIAIRMQSKDKETLIEVENTGSHIAFEELEKIWDKFYKVDKSRNRKLGGTGIGLSIVKNILTLHGFSFGASNIEHGVKFFFGIPKESKS
jgi:signal transduction histidine kinase